MKRMIAALALFLAACGPKGSGGTEIRVADAWARATAPDKKATAAYLTIANSGGAHDALVAVASSTGPAEVHSTSMDGGIMRMRKLDRLAIPKGATVKLEPGGTHVMLTGLVEPVKVGGNVDLTLRFE
ncbi:MAG: copper chaperone PCu(A)C, partial [Sphingomonas sp.]|nr:copper chaperone PCu(A)C [Sphingomonas sp.]